MLHIFAHALLIATRLDPQPLPPVRPRPHTDDEDAPRRRWLSIVGLRL